MGKFLCWKDSRLAVIAGASMTLGLSMFYVPVALDLWIVSAYYVNAISAQGCVPGSPCDRLVAVDGVVNIMAIAVAMELLAFITSSVALYGIAKDRRKLLLGWVVYMPVYILYQMATVLLMIINLQSLIYDGNTLPDVFSIFSLLASGVSSLVVQDNIRPAVTSSPGGIPADSSGALSQMNIYVIMLPFVGVIIFWFVQIFMNIVHESAVVKWYRSEDSRLPYTNSTNYNNAYRQPPPSKNDLMTYPAPYVTYPNMGYNNNPVAYRTTVPIVTSRPYYR